MAYNVTSFGKVYEGDNKQRINLSTFALSIVNDDMVAFNNPQKTNFINRIIMNYRFDADASIHFALEKEKARLESALQRLDKNIKNSVIKDLLKHKEKELVDKAKSYERGESCSFRLSKAVVDFLTDSHSECKEYRYYKKISLYLKALIEDYCSKPFVERERIYFADKVDIIETAIREKRKLTAVTGNGDCYSVYPYGIVCDRKSMYNYLVGYSCCYKTDEALCPMSMRLSADNEFKITRQTFFLNSSEKKNLETLLKTRGAQFLLGEEEEIHVILTETGIKQYNRQLHLRPTVAEIKEGNEYIFNCTPLQAEIYFMRLGKEAYITEPISLKEKIKNTYREAYDLYSGKKTE